MSFENDLSARVWSDSATCELENTRKVAMGTIVFADVEKGFVLVLQHQKHVCLSSAPYTGACDSQSRSRWVTLRCMSLPSHPRHRRRAEAWRLASPDNEYERSTRTREMCALPHWHKRADRSIWRIWCIHAFMSWCVREPVAGGHGAPHQSSHAPNRLTSWRARAGTMRGAIPSPAKLPRCAARLPRQHPSHMRARTARPRLTERRKRHWRVTNGAGAAGALCDRERAGAQVFSQGPQLHDGPAQRHQRCDDVRRGGRPEGPPSRPSRVAPSPVATRLLTRLQARVDPSGRVRKNRLTRLQSSLGFYLTGPGCAGGTGRSTGLRRRDNHMAKVCDCHLYCIPTVPLATG